MVRTGCLDDTGSVGTGVVRETASVGDSLGHFKCLMLGRNSVRAIMFICKKSDNVDGRVNVE